MRPFENEQLTDFTVGEKSQLLKQALAGVRKQLGQDYHLNIAGQTMPSAKQYLSTNPSQYDEVIGVIAQGDAAHAELALDRAWQAYATWSKMALAERSGCLFKLAACIRRRKAELTAWLILEIGKNWREADAEVAEAIDFCEYYGRQALLLAEGGCTTPYPGEYNSLVYEPLGVGVIIAPWNFPLAILVGMISSAIVCGNTVVVKPSNPGAVVAARAFALMQEAGIPEGVVIMLPGGGQVVGEYLVSHPKTRFVNFTGSQAVGLRIYEQIAITRPGQKWMKRLTAELGGKNNIIVDTTADLDAAAAGIVQSAFGFQGQKCSACSRAIVLAEVYDEVVARVEALTRALTIGPACDNHPVGAVIDELAFRKIGTYLQSGDGRIILGGGRDDSRGYFIEPTIFVDVDPMARLAQEEIFGPVLAVMRANDFGHALAISNNTVFGLTSSVYSNDRVKLERAKAEMHVGNLYINRGCTGAMVGAHPFGGFNMSGTNSKAGGPDYLDLFMQTKAITERL